MSGKPLRLRWALGAAAAVTGLVLMTVGTQRPIQDEAGGSTALGLLLALASGLLYATYTFASKRAMRHHRSSTGVMSATFGLGGLMLLPVLAAFGTGLIRSTGTLAVSAYLAVVAVFLAYWLFGVALRGIDASTATTVSLVEPVTAALLAVIVVGEHISLIGWLGIGLVLAAIASESASSDR